MKEARKMKATVNTKQFELTGLADAARANKYPDILFFAGGKVTVAGLEVNLRIRITLLHGDKRETVKKWSETVKLIPGGYGNMFDAKLLKRDLVDGDHLEFSFEVDTGSGYDAWIPVDLQRVEGPPNTPAFSAAAFLFDNGQGVSGLVGLMFLLA
jgi:hypothetical protein